MFQLFKADWIKGALMAAGGAILGYILQLVQTGGSVLHPNWTTIANLTFGAAALYLTKNYFTTADGKALGIAATAPPPAAKG